MLEEDVKKLLEKYRRSACTAEELALLETWYLKYENKTLPEITEEAQQQQADEIWAALPIHKTTAKQHSLWPKLAAAAVLLIVLSVSFYFYNKPNAIPQKDEKQARNNLIVPGGNKAILTLANGKKINLTDADSGELSSRAGIVVTKKRSGKVIFTVQNSPKSTTAEYNTIETPRGGQYEVVLPDGSRACLNAATTLRFPSNFDGMKERHIELDGEAYFEVVHNAAIPFIVSSGNQQVKVLGTHFDIMSYKDEREIRTTLLEGSVRLTCGNVTTILKPGEQGYLPANASGFVTSKVDVDQVVAWKNGLFYFKNTDLYALMRQLSRWYDVDVNYEPDVKNDMFFGEIERSADLKKVLKILELGDVHFRIEGHRLIVMK